MPQLVTKYHLHRTTILDHLKRAGIPRRPNVRKMTDTQVDEATRIYQGGLSLQRTAEHFSVSQTTITRELTAAGVPIRPRRGCT